MISQRSSPANILPCVLHYSSACVYVLWTREPRDTCIFYPSEIYPTSWTISYCLPGNIHCLAVEANIIQPLQWELCCAGLSKSEDMHAVSGIQAHMQHRWSYSAVAERAISVRVERQQFSSATGSKKLWIISVLWEPIHTSWWQGWEWSTVGACCTQWWVPFSWWRCGSCFRSAVKDRGCCCMTVLQWKGTWTSFGLPKPHPYTAENHPFHYRWGIGQLWRGEQPYKTQKSSLGKQLCYTTKVMPGQHCN